MKQYIDKDALVAEIEKLYNLEYYNTSNLSCGKKIILRDILLFLNTLEVKESLTLEDIKTIDKLLNQCVDYNNPYQEVLKRFKAQKGE